MTSSLADHLTIATREYINPLTTSLRRDARALQKRDIPVTLRETSNDGTAFFTFHLADAGEEQRRVFGLLVSRTMANYILREREPTIVQRLLKGQFAFLDETSLLTLSKTLPALLKQEKPRRQRRKIILLSFLQHFLEEGDVNIDGFIDFRLRPYWEYLSYLIICQINEIFRLDAQHELISFLLHCPDFEE